MVILMKRPIWLVVIFEGFIFIQKDFRRIQAIKIMFTTIMIKHDSIFNPLKLLNLKIAIPKLAV